MSGALGLAAVHPSGVSLRCPVCKCQGIFTPASIQDVNVQRRFREGGEALTHGIRICPNRDCFCPVYIATDNQGTLVKQFPTAPVDFDSSEIPKSIRATFTEAIICHSAHCFKASAIMVRRTLEELCSDQGATGRNLQERVQALSKVIILPPALLQAADELRLLGNDAAHLEARLYQEIGDKELLAAIALCKELLKAVYQYGSLLKQLTSLKSTST